MSGKKAAGGIAAAAFVCCAVFMISGTAGNSGIRGKFLPEKQDLPAEADTSSFAEDEKAADTSFPAEDEKAADTSSPAEDEKAAEISAAVYEMGDELDQETKKEVVDALIAYQKYIEEDDEAFKGLYGGYNLLYIDEDDIPELLATGLCEADGHKMIAYKDGKLSVGYIDRLYGISYAEKKNLYINENGNMGYFVNVLYKLENGEQKVLASGERRLGRDEEGNTLWEEDSQEYFWNGAACSGKEEYDNAIKETVKSCIGDAAFKSADFEEHYLDITEAYRALKEDTGK